MNRSVWMGCAAAGLLVALATPTRALRKTGVDLARLTGIRLPDKPPEALAESAKVLQAKLRQHYELDIPIRIGGYDANESAILIGRALAGRAGLIAEADLNGVRFDGHVIRTGGGRIAVAAYRPRGTIYAAWRLLEALGLKRYSGGRELPFGEVFTPLPGGKVPALAIANKPFFEYRSVLGYVSRGACGESFGDLGNPREAANPELFGRAAQKRWLPGEWLGADHTAGYLVPKQLYYEEHPEYFAIVGGKRRAKTTLMQRMTLCMSNPAVAEIARSRMVEWMDLQADRRFFYCSDADSGPCRCPKCTAMDEVFYYNTDRYLTWVNRVARAAGGGHPDNRLLAPAYLYTAKPPVRTGMEANVIALYCPWYWTSAGCRTADFRDPRNLTAMEEITGWLRRFPKQVGIYDYPGFGAYLWIRGMEQRIQWYARNGIRTVYCCGTPLLLDGLFHHVITRQLWDPFADTGEMTAEYLRAMYGRAAGPMLELVRWNDRVWDEQLGDPTRDPELVARFEGLLRQAQQLAREDSPIVRQRVDKNLLIYLGAVLEASNPRRAAAATADDLRQFRRRVLWYVETIRADAAEHRRNRTRWMVGQRERKLAGLLKTLGIDADALLAPATGKPAALIDRAIANRDAITAGVTVAEKPPAAPAAPGKVVPIVAFRSPADETGWRAACGAEGIDVRVAAATVDPPGKDLAPPARGMSVTLPFGRLPVRTLPISPRGHARLHAGWFVLHKTLAQPVDAAGCDAIEWTIRLSCDLPVSLVVAMEGAGEIRSDFHAHAGTQVLRTALAAHVRGRWPRDKWTGRVTAVRAVFWPRDNIYPHPDVKNASAEVLAVTARRGEPTPTALPFAGKAAWLARFAANIPHDIPAALRRKPRRGIPDAGRKTEGFRTFTSHRVLTPLAAIVTTPKPTPAELATATATRDYLARLTGVTLPINPAGTAVGPDAGNLVIVGRRAALAAGMVTEEELTYAGKGGFVLRARRGRVALAGTNDAATRWCLGRYLENHGVRFFEPGRREVVPRMPGGFLREALDVDRPYFANRPIPGGWKLATSWPAGAGAADGRNDRASALALAGEIQHAARTGRALTAKTGQAAARSPLNRYVAAKLTWNPFLDATRLIEEFQAPRQPTDRFQGTKR